MNSLFKDNCSWKSIDMFPSSFICHLYSYKKICMRKKDLLLNKNKLTFPGLSYCRNEKEKKDPGKTICCRGAETADWSKEKTEATGIIFWILDPNKGALPKVRIQKICFAAECSIIIIFKNMFYTSKKIVSKLQFLLNALWVHLDQIFNVSREGWSQVPLVTHSCFHMAHLKVQHWIESWGISHSHFQIQWRQRSQYQLQGNAPRAVSQLHFHAQLPPQMCWKCVDITRLAFSITL